MADFTDHNEVIELFNEAMRVETDNRERASEAHSFIDDPQGQWETDIFTASDAKPRYTFDLAGPIVNQVAGEMEQADFDIKVKPAGGEATKDDAMLLDGLIRNIENISSATQIFNAAGRGMVTAGIDGWRVTQRYIDDDSFDQDLIIDPILDFSNRVWFDPNARRQDKSDAKYCFVVQPIGKDEYARMFPDGSEQSVGQTICSVSNNSDWGYKPDDIFIGQIYYKKEVDREILLLTDGRVVERDDDFAKIEDELSEQGITIQDTRNRPKTIVVSRLFDASNFLIEPEDTVFSWIPVIPTYGNYKINRNKTMYHGVVQKLMDPQRVMNYSLSREIEEGALAPRAKYWMTGKQAAGYEDTLQTMNTNSDPVQFYNHDAEAPGAPQQNGGAQINPGLRTISTAMKDMIGVTAGLFAANMGDNPGLQSGVAIEKLQNKGDTGSITYFKSQEIAICHTARILIDAIPKVYDTQRQVRILKEDGSFDMKTLNEPMRDTQTNSIVTVNDLSKGKYDVTCSAGPSFQNRQQEAVSGIVEAAAVNPAISQISGDILTKNMRFPGAEQISERLRAQLFDAGMIPIEQMTDEEKQELQEAAEKRAQEGEQPTPEMLIGQAELIKAQNEQDKTQISVEEKGANIMLRENQHRLEQAKFMEQVRNGQATFAQTADQNQFNQIMTVQKQQADDSQAMFDTMKTMAETMKLIREAMGVDAITGPGAVENFIDQSDILGSAQETVEGSEGARAEAVERRSFVPQG